MCSATFNCNRGSDLILATPDNPFLQVNVKGCALYTFCVSNAYIIILISQRIKRREIWYFRGIFLSPIGLSKLNYIILLTFTTKYREHHSYLNSAKTNLAKLFTLVVWQQSSKTLESCVNALHSSSLIWIRNFTSNSSFLIHVFTPKPPILHVRIQWIPTWRKKLKSKKIKGCALFSNSMECTGGREL